MSRINAWHLLAVVTGLAGLGAGFVWGNQAEPSLRTAAFAPAASSLGATSATSNGITVTGSGTVSGTPDALKLAMGVQVTQPTVSAALDDANEAAAKVQASLKKSGVADKDLQTSGVSIQAQYSYDNNKQILTGYLVSENLTATLRNLKTAGAAISAAAAAGGNAARVDSVTLDLTDTSSLVTRAREAAFKQAKDKAAQYARVAGIDLGEVAGIAEKVATPPPSADSLTSVAAPRGTSPVPIQAGSQDVVVEVTVVFGIG